MFVPPPLPGTVPLSLPVGEGEKKRENYVGRAIVGGNIRFLSVSQVVAFSPHYEGGCPRRWYFQKVEGKKEEQTGAQGKGKEYAKEAEHYLTTGIDALSNVMRAGKHLLPKFGPDLEVERELAGSEEAKLRAIGLRDMLLKSDCTATETVASELRRVARLTAADIPFIGAFDFRHRRGEYIDSDGILRRESPGMIVCEVVDHKTTARIRDHLTAPKRGGQPQLLRGFAKTIEQIMVHPQWVGYGVHSANCYSDLTHVRLSAIYYQTKNGYTADKRTGLVTVGEIRDRWRTRVEPIVREMIDVARAKSVSEVPYNLGACRSFNKECPHAEYCDRPVRSVHDLVRSMFDLPGGEITMSSPNGIFDSLVSANGATSPSAPSIADLGLFGPAVEGVPKIQLPPALPMSDAAREAAVEAERQRLRALDAQSVQTVVAHHPLEGVEGYRVGQDCDGRGFYRHVHGNSCIGVERGHVCGACRQAPAQHTVGSINPADAPQPDRIAESDPLPPEAIAEITDPALAMTARAHAEAHARRAAEEAAERAKNSPKKSGGNCPNGGQSVVMSDREKTHRKHKCPGCGKELRIKDKDISQDCASFTVPKHRLAKDEAVIPSSPPALPVTAAVVTPPALPVNVSAAVAGGFGLFDSASVAPVEAVLPPALPVAVPAFGNCDRCGVELSANVVSRLQDGAIKHIGCAGAPAIGVAAPAPVFPPSPFPAATAAIAAGWSEVAATQSPVAEVIELAPGVMLTIAATVDREAVGLLVPLCRRVLGGAR